jgi:hypothetical protein
MVRTHPQSKASRDRVPSIRQERRNWKRNRREGRGSTVYEKFEEATSAVTRHGCRWGESSGGYEDRCEESQSVCPTANGASNGAARGVGATGTSDRNASNPMIGSGMQQARKSFTTLNGGEKSGENPDESVEKTGAVVQNDEVGTRFEFAARIQSGGNTVGRRTPRMRSMKGNRARCPDESQERRSARVDRGRWNGNTEMCSHSREERSPRGPDSRGTDG